MVGSHIRYITPDSDNVLRNVTTNATQTELFLALFAAEAGRAAERLDGRLSRATTPEDKVRAWVEAVLALAYDSRLAARARLFAGERASLAQEFPAEVDRCVRTQLAPLERVIAAGREFRQMGINHMGELLMATPALSDGVMYVRSSSSLFAVAKPKQASDSQPATRAGSAIHPEPKPAPQQEASTEPAARPASSASLLNGAQAPVPTGSFDSRWGGFR